MTDKKRKYDSTVARIAGNVAPAIFYWQATNGGYLFDCIAEDSVKLARLIVAEIERTEPPSEPD